MLTYELCLDFQATIDKFDNIQEGDENNKSQETWVLTYELYLAFPDIEKLDNVQEEDDHKKLCLQTTNSWFSRIAKSSSGGSKRRN